MAAYSTSEIVVAPEDGWVLASTAPVHCLIKPHAARSWAVAIAPSLPASTVQGIPMGGTKEALGTQFQIGPLAAAIVGNVYVRALNNTASAPVGTKDVKMTFSIIQNA